MVGVMKLPRTLLAYCGLPGYGTSADAVLADSSNRQHIRETAASQAFIWCGKQESDYITFGLPGLAPLIRVNNGQCVEKRVLGVNIPRENAEALRKIIARSRLLDKNHAIVEDDDYVVVPVLSMPPHPLLKEFHAKIVHRDFPNQESMRDPIDDIRDVAAIPEELKPLLPDKWELFGDVAVIKLDPRLKPYGRQAAEAYASVLRLKAVLEDVLGISGRFRVPTTKVLLGTDTVATHLENGVKYRFDAAQIMFSSGNVEERSRMADLDCDGEVIVDMFAGIGYFSLPLAVYQKPRKIIACEANPIAHKYLVENVKLNDVEKVVEPVLGDNRDLPGRNVADRVIMGYVKTTHEFLPVAMRLLKDGGILHYHETCPNELLPLRPVQRLVDNLHGGRAEILRLKAIKSYAPGVSHIVMDAKIFRPS